MNLDHSHNHDPHVHGARNPFGEFLSKKNIIIGIVAILIIMALGIMNDLRYKNDKLIQPTSTIVPEQKGEVKDEKPQVRKTESQKEIDFNKKIIELQQRELAIQRS